VKKIMENHQGKVQVESKPGQGTKFRLLFPVSDPVGAPQGQAHLLPYGG
jgi:signal transduction histidine kinase